MVDLVRRVIEQSRNRDPLVRAMALLCGARVLSASDVQAAKEAFAEGVKIAEDLPLSVRHRDLLLGEAVRLGATADPLAAAALFRCLPSDDFVGRSNSTGTMLVQSLAQSGDFEAALELLEDPHCETDGAQVVVHLAADPVVQRRAMFAGRERWRALRTPSDHRRPPFAQHVFYQFFSLHWRKLQRDEAQAWLDEILLAIETDPDQPVNASFGQDVELHTMREMHLFHVLNVVRALMPAEQVEALLHRYPSVAEAAEVYPLGMESVMAQQCPNQEGASSGSGRDARSIEAMMAAHRGDPGAVERLLTEAHELYLEDTNAGNPNAAPKIFWPSCHAYKAAMYFAGKHSTEDTEALLAEIPDADFSLLASIELAAGGLGLPQPSGVRVEHHKRRTRI